MTHNMNTIRIRLHYPTASALVNALFRSAAPIPLAPIGGRMNQVRRMESGVPTLTHRVAVFSRDCGGSAPACESQIRGFMTRRPMRTAMRRAVAPWVVALLVPMPSGAADLPPGLLVDPEGLQFSVATAYNRARDEYLIAFAGRFAEAIRLSPSGRILEHLPISPRPTPDNVNQVALGYNVDRDEYLAAWRLDEPQEIHARFLGHAGRPLGEPFAILRAPGSGSEPQVLYAPASRRYLLLWSSFARGTVGVYYQMIDADRRSSAPQVGPVVRLEAEAFSGQAAYGSASAQFLVVYTKDFSPAPVKDNVYGRFLSADGSRFGPEFPIGDGRDGQRLPYIASASAPDRWLVTFEDWANYPTQSADVAGAFVDADGTVGPRMAILATPGAEGWDTPGPIGYNPVTGTFLATSFWGVTLHADPISPASGRLGNRIIVSTANAFATSVAARTHPTQPQFLVTWRSGYEGVYAGLIDLQPAAHDGGTPTGGAPDGGAATDGGADGGGGADWGSGADGGPGAGQPTPGAGHGPDGGPGRGGPAHGCAARPGNAGVWSWLVASLALAATFARARSRAAPTGRSTRESPGRRSAEPSSSGGRASPCRDRPQRRRAAPRNAGAVPRRAPTSR
jgi:hypothetical protein